MSAPGTSVTTTEPSRKSQRCCGIGYTLDVDGRASACDAHRLRERGDVVGAVVAAAVDEEGRRAGHVAEVGAVDVLGDAGRAGTALEVGGEPVDVEPDLRRVADQVVAGERLLV